MWFAILIIAGMPWSDAIISDNLSLLIVSQRTRWNTMVHTTRSCTISSPMRNTSKLFLSLRVSYIMNPSTSPPCTLSEPGNLLLDPAGRPRWKNWLRRSKQCVLILRVHVPSVLLIFSEIQWYEAIVNVTHSQHELQSEKLCITHSPSSIFVWLYAGLLTQWWKSLLPNPLSPMHWRYPEPRTLACRYISKPYRRFQRSLKRNTPRYSFMIRWNSRYAFSAFASEHFRDLLAEWV